MTITDANNMTEQDRLAYMRAEKIEVKTHKQILLVELEIEELEKEKNKPQEKREISLDDIYFNLFKNGNKLEGLQIDNHAQRVIIRRLDEKYNVGFRYV